MSKEMNKKPTRSEQTLTNALVGMCAEQLGFYKDRLIKRIKDEEEKCKNNKENRFLDKTVYLSVDRILKIIKRI